MAAFWVTIFLSAFLLFQVQPLIGKYVLPWFGGSPAVWTTCMLFFQIMLLAGYAYSHLLVTKVKPRRQMIIHLCLLAAALVVLPIVPKDSWKPDPGDQPTIRILLLLTATIGLPYFVLSTTGPLLQAWFAARWPGRSPYRLYALSNVGSLLALISFPIAFEPHFTRHQQAYGWSIGLMLFAACCAWCAVSAARSRTAPAAVEGQPVPPPETLGGHKSVLAWILLPALASALLLATTNKLCADVAVVPFLWVVPLALYLVTFIIAFDSPRWYRRDVVVAMNVFALIAMGWAIHHGYEIPITPKVVIYTGTMFAACLLCHGEVARLKPDARHLTGYFLCISIGGALGGLFVAIIAPLIFNGYYEFHLCLALMVVVIGIVCWKTPASPLRHGAKPIGWVSGFVGAIVLAWVLARDIRDVPPNTTVVERSRNFYGVLTTLSEDESDPKLHNLLMKHGGIPHGMQYQAAELRRVATTYYNRDGGIGRTIRTLQERSPSISVGVIGLGAGVLCAYGRPTDEFRLYEINPDVIRLAQTRFTFLADNPAHTQVILGDGRLSIEREPESVQFDLLILDAFSGDAIPVHLLTSQCFDLYFKHLKPNGVIAVHISNYHLNLEPVMWRVVNRFDLHSALIWHHPEELKDGALPSKWVILSRTDDVISQPLIAQVSQPVRGWLKVRLWTDEDTNLLRIFRKKWQ